VNRRVVVIGRGKLGRALATQLAQHGVEVSLRPGTHAQAEPRAKAAKATRLVYVLAVPDAAIAKVAEHIAPRLAARDVVMHCAGARGLSELEAAAHVGAATCVLHPLVSFASRRKLPALAGATFVAHGAPRALSAARWLCQELEARCLVAPITGPAYHAAAALLANGSAALAYSAQRILVELGIAPRSAERALAGLLATVAHNVRALGVPAALTGPVSRGDQATVRSHLRALARLSPELAGHYRRTLPIIAACARAQRQR
jgi:predicted short-subunit dehydrogenase-like oxidoreductase (DUF2520 family)